MNFRYTIKELLKYKMIRLLKKRRLNILKSHVTALRIFKQDVLQIWKKQHEEEEGFTNNVFVNKYL